MTAAARTDVDVRTMANALRFLSADAVEAARSGHPGLPMGMADVATVLFTRYLRFDPTAPDWPDRDRFVLSAGHGSMLLYSLLHLTGAPEMTLDELRRFRQLGSLTAGHPEHGHCPGVETTTGPLGQGLATAVGMALAERLDHARFGDDLVDHRTFVIAGDGCLMEGISHEAIDLAGHLRLGRLVVLFDDNGISIDGSTDLSTSTDQGARFAAAGWQVAAVDGHDPEAVAGAIEAALAVERPSMVACRTTIGFGAPTRAGTAAVHGSPLGADELAATRDALDWPHAPFEVPDDVRDAWLEVGRRGARARAAWEQRLAAEPTEIRAAWADTRRRGLTLAAADAVEALVGELIEEAPTLATRQASQRVLERLVPVQGNLLGGSADLTGSNGTRTATHTAVSAEDRTGDYVHYGVREHAMAAAMNGIALHGGFVPYGGTFLAFADYSRPAIRLAALMGVPVVHVMTHDSIGLGEDGPTHQPVEHVASLRAIPGLDVLRPADAIETAQAWGAALGATDRPSVLCLTRQALPTLDRSGARGGVDQGAYLLVDPPRRDVTLLASGSEVALATAAAEALATDGISAAVVSMPCWERFERQSAGYAEQVLGTAPRVAVEAAVRFGWDRWLRPTDAFVGMTGFGASAPGPELYEHFAITSDAVADTARRLVT